MTSADDSIRVSPGRPVGGHTANKDLNRLPLSLIVLAAISIMVLIAAQIDDGFSARQAWLYVTILGAAFIVSRGLSDHGHR
jgi:hypothetical protein